MLIRIISLFTIKVNRTKRQMFRNESEEKIELQTPRAETTQLTTQKAPICIEREHN